MLQIRLLRVGKKHKPYFRLILVNKGKRPGNYLENLGFYSPADKKSKVQNLENERITYWISKGAQPTATVHNILVGAKVIDKAKVKVKIGKKKGVEVPVEAGAAQAAKPKEEAAPAEVPKAETVPAEAPKA